MKKSMVGLHDEVHAEHYVSRKKAEDIIFKAERPSLRMWFDIEHIRDSLRYKCVVDNLEALPVITQEIENSGFEIINANIARLLSQNVRAWPMATFDLRAPNGLLMEYHVIPLGLDGARTTVHEDYRKVREQQAEEQKEMSHDFGCARCSRPDVEQFYEDLRQQFQGVAELIFNSHLGVNVFSCPDCKQNWISVWTEVIGWEDEGDSAYTSIVPISAAEAQSLIVQAEDVCMDEIEKIGRHRRWLQRDHCNGVKQVGWREDVFQIGPHD